MIGGGSGRHVGPGTVSCATYRAVRAQSGKLSTTQAHTHISDHIKLITLSCSRLTQLCKMAAYTKITDINYLQQHNR